MLVVWFRGLTVCWFGGCRRVGSLWLVFAWLVGLLSLDLVVVFGALVLWFLVSGNLRLPVRWLGLVASRCFADGYGVYCFR